MTVNNKNIAINDKITAIELTKSNKNKDLKFHGGGSIELTDNLNSGTGGLILMRDNIIRLLGKIKPIKGRVLRSEKIRLSTGRKVGANDNPHKTGPGH